MSCKAILSKGVTTSRDLLKALSRNPINVCLLLSTFVCFQWQAKQQYLGTTPAHLAILSKGVTTSRDLLKALLRKPKRSLFAPFRTYLLPMAISTGKESNSPSHPLKRGHHIKRLAEGFIQQNKQPSIISFCIHLFSQGRICPVTTKQAVSMKDNPPSHPLKRGSPHQETC